MENRSELKKQTSYDSLCHQKSSVVYKEYKYAGLQNDMVNGMVSLTDIFDGYIKEFE
jgi:hypothetical protein